MFTTSQLVSALYVGLLNRGPDQSGKNFWMDRIESSNSTVLDMSVFIAAGQEVKDRYPEIADGVITPAESESLITQIYANLFDRAPDAAGKAFWQTQLENGTPIAELILNIINGAQGSDISLLTSKITAGETYMTLAEQYGGFNIEESRQVIELSGTLDAANKKAIELTLGLPAPETITETVTNTVVVAPDPVIKYGFGDTHPTGTERGEGTELIVGSGIPSGLKVLATNETAGFELSMGANYRQGDQLTGTFVREGVMSVEAASGPQTAGQGGAPSDADNRSAVSFDYTYNTGVNDISDSGNKFFLMIDTDPGIDVTNFVEVEFREAAPDFLVGFDTATDTPVIGDDVTQPYLIQESSNFGFGFLANSIVGGTGPDGTGDLPSGQYEVYSQVRDPGGDVITEVGLIFNLVDTI
jgi:hypothetical protein